jgi:hypothetical protein
MNPVESPAAFHQIQQTSVVIQINSREHATACVAGRQNDTLAARLSHSATIEMSNEASRYATIVPPKENEC